MTVAIAAAGTGGHIYPALAVAGALESRGLPRERIHFFGGHRMGAELVPDAGYRFVRFELTRLRREWSLENLRIPIVVRRTGAAMAEELKSTGCEVLIGMSGYVTVPAALAARRAGIPFLVHEQNADGSLAARFGARRAIATLLGLPGKAERLPRSVMVGNPLRPALAAFDRKRLRRQARERYGLDAEGRVVGILGGSLGAQVLNEAAPAIVEASLATVLHLTGPEAHGVKPDAASAGLPWVRLPFETEMEFFYAAVDLVICRAGGMTISELAATGTPAVLVPLERVGQAGNARALAQAGGAEVIAQAEVGSLPRVVGALLEDEPRLLRMSKGARSIARPTAADEIAARLLEAASG